MGARQSTETTTQDCKNNPSNNGITAKRNPNDPSWVNVEKKQKKPTVAIEVASNKQLPELLNLTNQLSAAINAGQCGTTEIALIVVLAMKLIKSIAKQPLNQQDNTRFKRAKETTNTAYNAHRLYREPVVTNNDTEESVQSHTMSK